MTLGNGSSPETLGRPGSSETETPALDGARGRTPVTLRSLAPAAGGEAAVAVHAGGGAALRLLASATAPTPADWEAQVTGLPEGWACIAPVAWPADAVPGGCEWELRVDLTPPRTAGTQARRWDFEVVLIERRTRHVGARLAAALEVLPFAALDLQVEPWTASGRRRARYVAVVANDGNRTVEVCLSAGDDAGRLRARVLPDRLELAAGERRRAEVVLRPRRPRLIGRAVQRRATVRARPDAGGAAPASREIAFLQKRAVPLWALALCAVAAAAAIAGLSRLPERVAVPAVQGARDAADAESALRTAGLTLDPHLRARPTAAARPGTILAQIPDPGTRVERGSRVAVLVAVGERRAVAPRLDGLTRARAVALVRGAGLSPGPALGAGGPDGVVAVQLPRAGQRVPRGTAVTVFLRPRGARRAARSSPGAAPPGSSTVRVPAIESRGTTAYTRALAGAGLVPNVIRAVHSAPAGTLVGVRPRPGTPVAGGGTVRVLVSAGVPRLAFDTGAVVRLLDPRTGRTVREAAPPQGRAVEPSWSADGRRVLYRVGRRLLVASGTAAERGRVVYDGADQYASAALAPTGAADVVALVRRTRGDGDLCLARVGDASLRPRCVRDRRWDLGRQISWRADGRELLVFGVRRGRPESFGILRYRTARPFSTTPSDWRGRLATDASVPRRGAIAAAYAPQGDRVALVTNAGVPRFQLAVASGRDLGRPVRTLPVRACEVAWRPDGGEIAVVQSDDACRRPLGDVVRVDVRRPRRTVTAASGARHPAYQPLTYAGPRGLG